MWEESLIESHPVAERRKFLTFPVALIVHSAVILGFVVTNYAVTDVVNPIRSVPIFWTKNSPPAEGTPDAIPHPRHSTNTQGTTNVRREPRIVPIPLTTDQSLEPQAGSSAGDPNDSGEGESYGLPGGLPGGFGNSENGFGIGVPSNDSVIELSPEVTEPVLIRRVEPEYPRLARISHIKGYVILRAIITKEGDVQIASVVRSDHPLLEKASVEAVKQWKYRPASFNSRPVAVYFQITVSFQLK
jgi:TonB family protein